MLQCELLIFKEWSIDTLPTFPIPMCDITTLDHEFVFDAVECSSFVVEGFSLLADAFFSSAECSEVFGGAW
jgi:hypothetical protein